MIRSLDPYSAPIMAARSTLHKPSCTSDLGVAPRQRMNGYASVKSRTRSFCLVMSFPSSVASSVSNRDDLPVGRSEFFEGMGYRLYH
ncbi:hypothetical protein AVEN_29553-1 [Araneus ventricosus]|uniref:Uncharacterized protein n=1 Tax=Araneus ventricosus TaxID=182803 RepID=A0A4Y2N859_ARAVE|nr:hypothetical protein AVEN_29553-1 [Araneus ventricosus]